MDEFNYFFVRSAYPPHTVYNNVTANEVEYAMTSMIKFSLSAQEDDNTYIEIDIDILPVAVYHDGVLVISSRLDDGIWLVPLNFPTYCCNIINPHKLYTHLVCKRETTFDPEGSVIENKKNEGQRVSKTKVANVLVSLASMAPSSETQSNEIESQSFTLAGSSSILSDEQPWLFDLNNSSSDEA
jgi:hypothetical protein